MKNKKIYRHIKEKLEYYEYGYYALKYIRNLFDQNHDDDDDDVYEDIEHLFDESITYYSFKNNGLEYEEIKKELIEEHDAKIIESCELIEDQKVEFCELIEDQKVEKFSRNGLKQEEIKKLLSIILKKEENKYLSNKNGLEYDEIEKLVLVITKKECSKYGIEYIELVEDQYQKADGIIKHQKVEDIKMPKSSKNESDKIKELGLTVEELKEIARKIANKNYEILSRIRLLEEIDKLEASKELEKKKIVSSLLLKGKKILIKPKKKANLKKMFTNQ